MKYIITIDHSTSVPTELVYGSIVLLVTISYTSGS